MKIITILLLLLLHPGGDGARGRGPPMVNNNEDAQVVLQLAVVDSCRRLLGKRWTPAIDEFYYVTDPEAPTDLPGMAREFGMRGISQDCVLPGYKVVRMLQDDQATRNAPADHSTATPHAQTRCDEESEDDKRSLMDELASAKVAITALVATLSTFAALAAAAIAWVGGWISKLRAAWTRGRRREQIVTERKRVGSGGRRGGGMRQRSFSDSTPDRPRRVHHLHLHALASPVLRRSQLQQV